MKLVSLLFTPVYYLPEKPISHQLSQRECFYLLVHISLSVYNKYTCAEVYLRVYVFMCAHVCAFVNLSACKTSLLSEPMGVGYGTEVVKKKTSLALSGTAKNRVTPLFVAIERYKKKTVLR